jgi:CheY-like chemotaxis protein
MVYGIVKQSDGYIWINSAPGAGTTFNIYLPAVPSPEASVMEPCAIIPATTEQHVATVMLAEDDPALRSVILRVLGKQGYTVLSATDGEDALAEDDRYGETIHMLITDVVMPKMGGPELARRMAQKHSDMRVLFVTGYSQEAMARHGGLLPGAQLLKKPFTPEELALAASELLDSHPAMERAKACQPPG